jgi:hypothetical protein
VYVFFDLYLTLIKKIPRKKWHQRRKQIVTVGEFSEESTKEIKVVPLEYFGHPHRKEHLRKEKRNETPPILEFLESSLCGVADTLSGENAENLWRSAWNSDCYDI